MWKLNKNIIIEGPDLAGKSTLKALFESTMKLPLRAERIGRIDDPIEKVATAFADVTRQERLVLDRCHFISDMVYEKVLGKPESIFYNIKDEAFKAVAENCIVIYVSVPTPELRARYITRGDDLRSWEEIDRAAEEYGEFFSKDLPFTVIEMDGFMDEHNMAYLTQQLLDAGVIKWSFTQLTEGSIQSIVDKCKWEITKLGDRTTVVQATLPNGYILTESSSSASVENFSMSYGTQMCKKKIIDRIWDLEAYRLKGEN